MKIFQAPYIELHFEANRRVVSENLPVKNLHIKPVIRGDNGFPTGGIVLKFHGC